MASLPKQLPPPSSASVRISASPSPRRTTSQPPSWESAPQNALAPSNGRSSNEWSGPGCSRSQSVEQSPTGSCDCFRFLDTQNEDAPNRILIRVSQILIATVQQMTTYIALLRAVNVGGTGKLPMSELKAMCEKAGFTQVRTYIASGNVVFTSRKSETAV